MNYKKLISKSRSNFFNHFPKLFLCILVIYVSTEFFINYPPFKKTYLLFLYIYISIIKIIITIISRENLPNSLDLGK